MQYRGHTLQGSYDGGFVYARKPYLPKSALAKVARVARVRRSLVAQAPTVAAKSRYHLFLVVVVIVVCDSCGLPLGFVQPGFARRESCCWIWCLPCSPLPSTHC